MEHGLQVHESVQLSNHENKSVLDLALRAAPALLGFQGAPSVYEACENTIGIDICYSDERSV